MMSKWCIIFILCLFRFLVGCNDGESEFLGNLGTNMQISDCGGFETTPHEVSDEEPRCRDERLLWTYDQASQTVTFLNQAVWLNCCGEHAITISIDEDGGRYRIEEIDRPDSAGGRCLCMCFFDFTIDLPNIEPVRLSIELYRHVTDEGPQALLWQGELDLSKTEGDELIQANVGECEEH